MTATPTVVRRAVPALLEAAVAVQAAVTVAFAVAPAATVRISEPFRSVMTSTPKPTVNLSLPMPPVRVSLPTAPMRVSLPVPPIRLSLPSPPVIKSLPAPPSNVKSMKVVRPAVKTGAPAWSVTTAVWPARPPVRVSLYAEPIAFSIERYESGRFTPTGAMAPPLLRSILTP